jgi:hypothetical protein
LDKAQGARTELLPANGKKIGTNNSIRSSMRFWNEPFCPPHRHARAARRRTGDDLEFVSEADNTLFPIHELLLAIERGALQSRVLSHTNSLR